MIPNIEGCVSARKLMEAFDNADPKCYTLRMYTGRGQLQLTKRQVIVNGGCREMWETHIPMFFETSAEKERIPVSEVIAAGEKTENMRGYVNFEECEGRVTLDGDFTVEELETLTILLRDRRKGKL